MATTGDYLVNGVHYSTLEEAIAAQNAGGGPPPKEAPGVTQTSTASNPPPETKAQAFERVYAAVMAGGDAKMMALYRYLKEHNLGDKDVSFGGDGSIFDGKTGAVIKGPDSDFSGILGAATRGASITGVYDPNYNGSTNTSGTGTKDTGGSSSGSGGSTTTTMPSNGGSATGAAADTHLIESLLGLVSNMYAGAGVSGGGSGYSGVISAPIASEAIPSDVPVAASGGGHKGLLLLGALIAGVAVWYWYKHRKGS